VAEIKSATHALARALGVVGLMNVQFAVKWEQKGVRNHFSTAFHPQEAQTDREMVPDTFLVYVIEVNPRASRTVPFVSKAVGLPVAKIAAKAMVGVSLAEQGVLADPVPAYVSVKESVFPFVKFPGVDIVLGPEMKSTGEVMGTNRRFSIAFAKSQLAAGTVLPLAGKIFISVAERHKAAMTQLARRLAGIGFEILATPGTADALEAAGVTVQRLKKIQDGGPNLLDYFDRDEVDLVMNTPVGKGARTDEGRIRAAAVTHGVPCITTMEAAHAAVRAMEALQQEELTVQALQDRLHP
jgi:carbamoyl-phosphate synthase large subunit